MSQTMLLQKLARYLKLTNSKMSISLQKDLRKHGHCYGLSICYASMKLIGKLTWWEAALKKIANWDGRLKSLKQKACLPNAEDPNETLEHIFERVLNYTVFNQVQGDHKSYESIMLDGISQPTFLLPKNAFFEILTPDEKIAVIKQRKSVAGFFNARDLVDLLDEKTMANTICLIHSTYHTICVSYQKPNWIIYDPNYDHNVKNSTSIHKKFKTKIAAVKEILEIQGHSLAIECASFKSDKEITFPAYEKIIKTSPCQLFQELGFHTIVTEIPERMPEFIEKLKKAKQGPLLIACALVQLDESNWSGLHKLAYFAPEQLPAVLECASESSVGYDCIAEAIEMVESDDGWSGFYLIVEKAPESLPQLLDYLACSAIGPDSLVNALIIKSKKGESGWDMVNQSGVDCKKLIEKIVLNGIDNVQTKNIIKLIAQVKQSDIQEGKAMRPPRKSHLFFDKNTNKFEPALFIKQLTSVISERKVPIYAL